MHITVLYLRELFDDHLIRCHSEKPPVSSAKEELTGGGKVWFRQMAGYGSDFWKIMIPPQVSGPQRDLIIPIV